MAPSDTRDALLNAAAELLAEGGLGEATTQKVARRAGVAEGTIYRHFPNKEAVLEAVFARAWVRLNEDLEARLPSRAEPEARLRAYLGTALAVMGSHPQETTLLRLEFSHLMAGGGCPVPAGSLAFIAVLEESLRLAQEAGRARPGLDPAVTALFIYNGLSKTWSTLQAGPGMTRFVAGLQTFLDAALFV